MMRCSIIKKSREKAAKYFAEQQKLGNKSKIYTSCKSILRTTKFIIDYHTSIKMLNNPDLI